ncbi:MAG: hypothetical protein V3U70_00385 [Thermoplasmata archaeon]
MKERVWGRFVKGRLKGMRALFIVPLIVLGVALVVLWPFVFIWALNTIFGLGIPLNFWTWLATIVILLTVAAIAK